MEDKMQLFHGDCIEIMQKIPPGSIDMILCDLPYGMTACQWDEVIPFESLWNQYNRIVKENGAIVLFGSEPFSTKLRYSQLNIFRYDWIWRKPKGSGFFNAKKMPLKNHEIASVFYKKSLHITHKCCRVNLTSVNRAMLAIVLELEKRNLPP